MKSIQIFLLAGLCFTLNMVCMNLAAQNNYQKQIDSLSYINRTHIPQDERINNTNEIALLFGETNLDSTVYYANQALNLAQQISYNKGAAYAYYILARASNEVGKLPDAIKNYNHAISIYEKEDEKKLLLAAYRGISYAYSYGSSQMQSIKYSLKALDIAKFLGDSSSISVVYNNLASAYKRIGNYELSINYFEKSLDIEAHHHDTLNMAIAFSNIGAVKVDNNMSANAKSDYSNLISLLPSIDHAYLTAYFYLSLSGYYTDIEKFDSALVYINQAETICKTGNFLHIEARMLRKRGELLFKQKQYLKSIQALNKCIDLSNASGIFEEFPRIYHFIAQAYAQTGNYKQSFFALQKEIEYRSSAQNKKVSVTLAEYEEQQKHELELEKQALERDILAQQNENKAIRLKARYRLTLISSLLLLLVLGLLFLLFNRLHRHNKALNQRNKTIDKQKLLLQKNLEKLKTSESDLKKTNATKDKFFSIIAHDLRGPFSSLMGLSNELYVNYDDFSENRKKKIMGIISNSTKNTFNLLDNLLSWARSQSDKIVMEKTFLSIKSITMEAIEPYLGSASSKSLKIENNLSEETIVYADQKTLKVVIANLFNNAIKFTDIGGKISFHQKITDEHIEICIQDTGIGMSQDILTNLFDLTLNTQRPGTDHEKGTGLGLYLCQEFIHKNKGELRVESEENIGSKFFFTLPISS